jgi:hypothetical protein
MDEQPDANKDQADGRELGEPDRLHQVCLKVAKLFVQIRSKLFHLFFCRQVLDFDLFVRL